MGLSDRAILLVKILLATILFSAVFAGVISYQARRIPHPVEMHMPGNRRALLYQLQESPRPTLILLHPYSGDALSTARYSGFLQAAIPRRFNVIIPDAIGHEWHDSPDEFSSHDDDIAFLADLVERLIAAKIADPKRFHRGHFQRRHDGVCNGRPARPLRRDRHDQRRYAEARFRKLPAGRTDAAGHDQRRWRDVLPYAGGHVGDPGAFFRTTADIQVTAAIIAKSDNETAARQPTRTQHVMANMSSNALSG
jgi:hypothetical protein